MGFKDQLIKLRDNWLIIVLILVLAFVLLGGGRSLSSLGSSKSLSYAPGYSADYASESYNGMGSKAYNGGIGGQFSGNFAPNVEDRKIVKTTSLSTEVERGEFKAAEDRLKNIVSSSDSFLLVSSSNLRGIGKKGSYYGSYSIKVDTEKYDSVVAQLKEIGKVTYFNENANDITGGYTNAQIELDAEKERLNRYNSLYDDKLTTVSDKIELIDKVYNQERTIKYWEDSIKSMDQKIDYSTVQVTLTEKSSEYINVELVSFSELVKNLVSSFNGLLHFLFVILPWVIVAGIIWLIVHLARRKNV